MPRYMPVFRKGKNFRRRKIYPLFHGIFFTVGKKTKRNMRGESGVLFVLNL